MSRKAILLDSSSAIIERPRRESSRRASRLPTDTFGLTWVEEQQIRRALHQSMRDLSASSSTSALSPDWQRGELSCLQPLPQINVSTSSLIDAGVETGAGFNDHVAPLEKCSPSNRPTLMRAATIASVSDLNPINSENDFSATASHLRVQRRRSLNEVPAELWLDPVGRPVQTRDFVDFLVLAECRPLPLQLRWLSLAPILRPQRHRFASMVKLGGSASCRRRRAVGRVTNRGALLSENGSTASSSTISSECGDRHPLFKSLCPSQKRLPRGQQQQSHSCDTPTAPGNSLFHKIITRKLRHLKGRLEACDSSAKSLVHTKPASSSAVSKRKRVFKSIVLTRRQAALKQAAASALRLRTRTAAKLKKNGTTASFLPPAITAEANSSV